MDTIGSAIAADTEQFEIVFNAGGQVVNDTITLVALAAAQPIPEPASLTLLVGTLWFGLAPSSPHTLASPQRDDVGLENPARVAPDCLNLLAKRHEFERIVDCGVDPVIVPISPEEAASAIDTTAAYRYRCRPYRRRPG